VLVRRPCCTVLYVQYCTVLHYFGRVRPTNDKSLVCTKARDISVKDGGGTLQDCRVSPRSLIIVSLAGCDAMNDAASANLAKLLTR